MVTGDREGEEAQWQKPAHPGKNSSYKILFRAECEIRGALQLRPQLRVLQFELIHDALVTWVATQTTEVLGAVHRRGFSNHTRLRAFMHQPLVSSRRRGEMTGE